jgi:hypothetical protein
MSARLRDIEVILKNRPGALSDFGEILGAVGVSLEGGGVFTHDSIAVAHFLVGDAETARSALERAGIGPVRIHDVVMLQLDQENPGQLGLVSRRMRDAGVNILVQYSDHDHSLVLIVSDGHYGTCAAIAAEWRRDRGDDA